MRRLAVLRPGDRVISDREFFCAIEAITRGLAAEAFGPGAADTIVAQARRPTIARVADSALPPAPVPRTGLRQLAWVTADNVRIRLSGLRLMKRLIDIEVRLDNQDEAWGTWREANDPAGRHGLHLLDGGRS
jgi:hypothetical protein